MARKKQGAREGKESLELFEAEGGGELMEHNVILQAINPDDGSMKTWEYFTIKSYLVAENHRHSEDSYKFHKAWVNGEEVKRTEWNPLLRDVWDFKTYCRQNVDRKHIDTDVPMDILRKFLLEENMNKRNRIYKAIQEGKNINDFYNNGGGGLCEYRPGHISGYCYFKAKGVEIEWINADADVCKGMVTRKQILNEIKALINEGTYCDTQQESKPRTIFYEDSIGQITIGDWLTI